MEDSAIIRLFEARDERGISEVQDKYGLFCLRLARNITGNEEDARECVNDAWLRAWNHIPPEKPENLRAWLGRIVRNLALNRLEKERAEKRSSVMTECLDEWEDCLSASSGVEEEIDGKELTRLLNNWLETLPAEDRRVFVRRYWYGDSVKEMASRSGIRAGAMRQRLYRLRLELRALLTKEGYTL